MDAIEKTVAELEYERALRLKMWGWDENEEDN